MLFFLCTHPLRSFNSLKSGFRAPITTKPHSVGYSLVGSSNPPFRPHAVCPLQHFADIPTALRSELSPARSPITPVPLQSPVAPVSQASSIQITINLHLCHNLCSIFTIRFSTSISHSQTWFWRRAGELFIRMTSGFPPSQNYTLPSKFVTLESLWAYIV